MLVTSTVLTAGGWVKRGYTDREEMIFRFDIPERPGCWLEVRESVAGWRGEFVRLGLHCPYGPVTTLSDLDRFVAMAKAGKL